MFKRSLCILEIHTEIFIAGVSGICKQEGNSVKLDGLKLGDGPMGVHY